jgi:hypothetical protein
VRRCASGYTIAHLARRNFLPIASALLLLALIAGDARAQGAPSLPDDAFAKGHWRAEFLAQAALEAWNYNPSHEELYGLVQGVTFGVRNGLVLIARQRLSYISQRRNDSRALGITSGLRTRIYRRGRTSGFLQFELGISDAAVALPPGGTRFNYLAIGGGGVTVQINRRLQAIAALEVIHISNAGLAGPDRNPDIEAIGPAVGISVGF